MDEHEKILRTKKAVIEDDVDSDWCFFDDRLEQLEQECADMQPSLAQEAVGLVIVQCYLNRMRREFEDLDDCNRESNGTSGDV